MRGARPLSKPEVERVLEAFSGRHRCRDSALFLTGIYSGFRISELLSLRVKDVTEDDGRISGRITVQRQKMKGRNRSRSVVLHREARKALERYLFESAMIPAFDVDPLRRLFPFTRQHAHRILHKAFKAAGLTGKLGTHVMRKTYAVGVFNNLGRNVFLTAKALGHQSPTSTMSYLSFRQSEIDAAVLRL